MQKFGKEVGNRGVICSVKWSDPGTVGQFSSFILLKYRTGTKILQSAGILIQSWSCNHDYAKILSITTLRVRTLSSGCKRVENKKKKLPFDTLVSSPFLPYYKIHIYTKKTTYRILYCFVYDEHIYYYFVALALDRKNNCRNGLLYFNSGYTIHISVFLLNSLPAYFSHLC